MARHKSRSQQPRPVRSRQQQQPQSQSRRNGGRNRKSRSRRHNQQQWWFTSFVQLMSLLSGMLTILVGVVHAASRVERWCTDAEPADTFSCIGPALFWSENDFLELSNGPSTWGSVFSLAPNVFMDNFAPVAVGLITLSVHLPGEEYLNPIGRSWTRYFVWFLLVSLFANVGYAGNLGVVVGLLNILMAFTCLIVRFSNEERRPTDLDVIKPTRSCRCFEARLTVLVSIGRMLTMLVTFITVAVGLIHIFSQFTTWCDEDEPSFNPNEACVGPLLFWGVTETNVSTAVTDRNTKWRDVVGLTPAALANNLTPLIIGIMMMLAHRKGSPFQALLRSWYRVSLLCVLVALFASFGFAGNVGIISGFVLSGTSLIHMFVALLDADVQRPFLQVQVQFLAPDNANDSDDDLEANRRTSRNNRNNNRSHSYRHSNRSSHNEVTTSEDESQSGDEIGYDDDVHFKQEDVATYNPRGFFGKLARQMSSSNKNLNVNERERRRKRGDNPSRSKSNSHRNDGDVERGSRSRSRPRDGSRGRHGDDGRRFASRTREQSNNRSSSLHRHVSNH